MGYKQPLIIGEVLFDHFGDNSKVLGGAPFNVAWNLKALGADPLFVSAIGNDQPGNEILQRIGQWNLDTSGIQHSEKYPTGRVVVSLKDEQPTFDIIDEQAYDDIKLPKLGKINERFSWLYHGTLAYRNIVSRQSIRNLRQRSQLPVFLDMNIRQPWFEHEWLEEILPDTDWLKLNEQELAFITESECNTNGEIRQSITTLRERFGTRNHLITCGARGVFASDEDANEYFISAPKPVLLRDTVGAGDAFAAACIYGLMQNQPMDVMVNHAAHFASHICTFRGATNLNLDSYKMFVESYDLGLEVS